MLVDHHCHLDFPDFAADLDGVVARARAAGVGAMVTISTRIRKFDQVLAVACELAFADREDIGGLARTGLVQWRGIVEEDVVEPTVIMSFEAKDLCPSRNTAGQSNSRMHSLAARAGKSNHLSTRNKFAKLLRRFDFKPVLAGVHKTAIELALNSLNHRAGGVSQ